MPEQRWTGGPKKGSNISINTLRVDRDCGFNEFAWLLVEVLLSHKINGPILLHLIPHAACRVLYMR